MLAAVLVFLSVIFIWSSPPCPGVQTRDPVMSGLSENSWNMFFRKAREDCWAAYGPGFKMDVSAAVESEKILNSHKSGFPSIISHMSIEACINAIISALWLPAFLARGTLYVKTVQPAWMPVVLPPFLHLSDAGNIPYRVPLDSSVPLQAYPPSNDLLQRLLQVLRTTHSEL